MIRWVVAVMFVACGNAPREAPRPPPMLEPAAPAFVPTSFGVDVTGRGRPIIFIPGLGCPGAVWDETVQHFGGKIEAHVLTLAGFAGRPAVDAPLMATARGELARYIRDRKLDHPVVIGHSLGGVLAFWLAETAPDVIGPLIIVDAAPAMFGSVSPPGGKDNDPWRNATDVEFAAKVRELFSKMAVNTQRLEPVITAVARSDKRTIADALDDLATIDIGRGLANIRAQTLVVLSDDHEFDDMVTQQIAAIPRQKIVVLANTKHFVFFDDPVKFFRTLDDFLAH